MVLPGFRAALQALVDALAAKLPAGVLRTGVAVTAVSTASKGVAVEAAGKMYSSDRLIVAAPLRVAEDSITWSPALGDDLVRAMQDNAHMDVGARQGAGCLSVSLLA